MSNKMLQRKVKILYQKRLGRHYFRCGLAASEIARQAWPGQFLNIRLSDNYDPLLRRPFSVHNVRLKSIELLYEALGKGTRILSQKKPGEFLDIIGPLGNGFGLGETTRQRNNEITIIAAGGMGVAPLIFLAEKLRGGKRQKAKGKTLVLIGAKTKNHILCEKEFKQLGCEVKVSTDDGSMGFKGKVTGLLKKVLRLAISDKRLAIYACGPKPMLKEISTISKEYSLPAQISLEAHMACGFGACLGCVVNTKGGYKRVCKEGPVFSADEIIWE